MTTRIVMLLLLVALAIAACGPTNPGKVSAPTPDPDGYCVDTTFEVCLWITDPPNPLGPDPSY